MKVNEILAEARVGTLRVGPLIVDFDQHFIDQVRDRRISPKRVDSMLSRLPQLADKISSFETGQRVWIQDPVTNLSVGLRGSGSYRVKLKTIVFGQSWQSDTPVLQLPSH